MYELNWKGVTWLLDPVGSVGSRLRFSLCTCSSLDLPVNQRTFWCFHLFGKDRNFPDCGLSARGEHVLTLSSSLRLFFIFYFFSHTESIFPPKRKFVFCVLEMSGSPGSLRVDLSQSNVSSSDAVGDAPCFLEWHQLSRNQSAHAWLTTHCGELTSSIAGGGGEVEEMALGMWMTSWLLTQTVSIVVRPQHSRACLHCLRLLDLILGQFTVNLNMGSPSWASRVTAEGLRRTRLQQEGAGKLEYFANCAQMLASEL